MAKRLLVVLCVLALLCQSVAMAEDITTPSDLPLVCEACGGKAQLSYVRDADGSHVAMCPHGVVSEKSRHEETGSAGYISVSDTEHAVLCYCGLVNEKMTSALAVVGLTRHIASCKNPSACAYCGATDGSIFQGAVMHKSSRGYEGHDDTSHWDVCENCGEKYNQSTHKANCDQPTVCQGCGAEGVSFDGIEHGTYVYDHDETKHWQVCTKCGAISDESMHWAYCDNPTVCAGCEAENVTMGKIDHRWMALDVDHDETKHWQVCTKCGERTEEGGHYAYCCTPTICYGCGAEDVTMVDLIHNYPVGYEYNETKHWQVCADCGEREEWAHYADCDNPTVCRVCGAEGVTMRLSHIWPDEYEHDETKHWQVCTKCGERTEEGGHYAYCCTPTICYGCGAEGVMINYIDHSWTDEYEYDETKHWQVCADCGEREEWAHYADCDNPTVCRVCGAEGVTMSLSHIWPDEYEHDAAKHWRVCTGCGEREEWVHYADCDNPTVCAECGAEGVMINYIDHSWTDEYEYDETKHWYVCADCGERVERQHYAYCGSPTVCYICGAEGVTTNYVHNMPDGYEHDGTNHWQYCLECNEKIEEPHAPSAEDPTKCAVCGATISGSTAKPTDKPTTAPTDAPVVTDAPTTAPTDAPVVTDAPTTAPTDAPVVTDAPTTAPTDAPVVTDAPTTAPTDAPVVTDAPTTAPTAVPTATPIPLPTVTTAPTRKPSTGKPTATKAPAHEHTYDVAFVSNNDGTHSKTCLAEDCDETITEPCTLVTTDMGLMTCTACAKCGYAVYTAKAGVAALTEGEDVPAVIARVKTASIVPAAGAAADVIPDDTLLVVHETTFEVPVALSKEIKGTVEKVFTAALIKNGESIQPAGAVQLAVPVDVETAAQLDGKVLMLLREDGTLMEIPFELENGVLVFSAEELGVFLLVNPET